MLGNIADLFLMYWIYAHILHVKCAHKIKKYLQPDLISFNEKIYKPKM